MHTVFVDGVRVVDDYHCTKVDELALYAMGDKGYDAKSNRGRRSIGGGGSRGAEQSGALAMLVA